MSEPALQHGDRRVVSGTSVDLTARSRFHAGLEKWLVRIGGAAASGKCVFASDFDFVLARIVVFALSLQLYGAFRTSLTYSLACEWSTE